ncbi:CHC2 zinc finger domain-containing protein [Sphingomicrobium astaxanthinifaciens]|uniref:CHC2 zinc finger domain-containing protein n=1 Tax=Sphingomicrobium astaxanthinifaciens TaxID=1227949 RepID=UPI001FCC5447|nr:CHC2 zinc finger domain-containing protein [Sphingomicrobium astaxanthinifaciens]MCJ7420946.1 CHC2 zinc finger domain-containing protein [Sphingomicrobium astaxanthinifaciens]
MSVIRDATARKLETPIAQVIEQYVPLKKQGDHYMGQCPFHTDRTPSFMVQDNVGNWEAGHFHCFGCEAHGDVYDFLKRYHGISFIDALYMLGAEPEVPMHDLPPKPFRDGDKRAAVERIWSHSYSIKACSPVGDYLASRGIAVEELSGLENLRETKLPFRGDGKEHPVLIAGLRDGNGDLTAIQRTFLTPEGQKLAGPESKRSLGTVRGSAVKIGDSVEELVICEGLEDALTLRLANPSVSVWAAAGGNMLCSLPIPDECTRLTIARDNDEAGKSAVEASAKMFWREGRQISVMAPSPEFKDFNEELQASLEL